jgi:ABC-type transport system involved in multi-copper enzyme maturation permease subunit
MTTVAASPTTRHSRPKEFAAGVVTIMVKELRSRFRGRRAFLVLTIYLAVLALIAYGGYVVVAPSAREQAQFGGSANASATVGYAIFILLSLFQLLLVCFIAPAFTAGAISLEREKQTLDLLVTTPLRPGAIVVGKLLSALAYVGLMILAAIPLSALVLMYGGASVDDIVRQQVVLLVTAVGFGSIGLFFSTLMKRTQAATVLTYCAMLALTIGTVLLFIFWSVLSTRDSDNAFGAPRRAPEQLMWVNPAVAMIDVIANTEVGFYGPFSSMLTEILGGQAGVTCQGDVCFNDPGGPVPVIEGVRQGAAMDDLAACPPNARCLPPDQGFGAAIAQPAAGVSGHFWPRFSLTFGVMSLLLTLASMRLVVPVGMRFVFRRRKARTTGAAGGDLPIEAIES